MTTQDYLRVPIGEAIRGTWRRLAEINWRKVFTSPGKNRMPSTGVFEQDLLPPIVLYVDDDPLAVKAMERRLRGQPFALVATDDPEKAQELIRTIRFHLVICDVFMPGVSGVELLLDVRRLCEGTPVLMFSANPPAWLRDAGFTERDACLEKGCSDSDLLFQVHRMIRAAG